MVPKEAKIISKGHAVGVAGCQEPGVQAEPSHEASNAATVSGGWSGNTVIAVGLFEDLMEMDDVLV